MGDTSGKQKSAYRLAAVRRETLGMAQPMFAIRDDDTCYFTRPAELDTLYARLAGVPVSLAVTPYAIRSHHLGDPARFFQEGPPESLGRNAELTAYLRECVAGGRYSVLLHGNTHEYRRNGHRLVPECVWKPGSRQAEETAAGKRYLQNLLETEVRAFVPPGNAISFDGVMAVSESIESILATLPLRRPGEFLARGTAMRAWMRRAWDEFRWGGPGPFPYQIGRARLLACSSWTVQADWDATVARMALCKRLEANFVIAVHYWELQGAVRDQFYRLVDRALAMGFLPAHCSQLFADRSDDASAPRYRAVCETATQESEGDRTWVGSKTS